MRIALLFLAVVATTAHAECKFEAEGKDQLTKEAVENILEDQRTVDALAKIKETRPDLFDNAFACALFPKVRFAAIGLGGGRGKGDVYQQGTLVGKSTLTQGSVGFQLGFKSYTEIIFFLNESAFDKFIDGGFAFDGKLSAVAGTTGTSRDADYNNKVAVITHSREGLLLQFSLGVQRFDFRPNDNFRMEPEVRVSN